MKCAPCILYFEEDCESGWKLFSPCTPRGDPWFCSTTARDVRASTPVQTASSKGTVADAVAKDVVQDATPPRFGMELSIYDLPEYPRSTTTS